jgi:hypothetical protein
VPHPRVALRVVQAAPEQAQAPQSLRTIREPCDARGRMSGTNVAGQQGASHIPS